MKIPEKQALTITFYSDSLYLVEYLDGEQVSVCLPVRKLFGWFCMSTRTLVSYIPEFTNVTLNIALNYLYQQELIFKDTESGQRFPFYYKVNPRILNRQLTEHQLPAIKSLLVPQN